MICCFKNIKGKYVFLGQFAMQNRKLRRKSSRISSPPVHYRIKDCTRVIIGEPKYKYGQQEQATVRNHNRSTALERSVLKYWGGGLNRFYGIPTSPLGSAVLHYKCNIKHITHNNKEYEVCICYNPPPIKFVTLINKMSHNRSTALERSIINYWGA